MKTHQKGSKLPPKRQCHSPERTGYVEITLLLVGVLWKIHPIKGISPTKREVNSHQKGSDTHRRGQVMLKLLSFWCEFYKKYPIKGRSPTKREVNSHQKGSDTHQKGTVNVETTLLLVWVLWKIPYKKQKSHQKGSENHQRGIVFVEVTLFLVGVSPEIYCKTHQKGIK